MSQVPTAALIIARIVRRAGPLKLTGVKALWRGNVTMNQYCIDMPPRPKPQRRNTSRRENHGCVMTRSLSPRALTRALLKPRGRTRRARGRSPPNDPAQQPGPLERR